MACADARAVTQRYERQTQTMRIVARVVDQDVADPREANRLIREASERLDQEDFYGDLLDRPVPELVAMICKDLGIEPDLFRFAQEAWA